MKTLQREMIARVFFDALEASTRAALRRVSERQRRRFQSMTEKEQRDYIRPRVRVRLNAPVEVAKAAGVPIDDPKLYRTELVRDALNSPDLIITDGDLLATIPQVAKFWTHEERCIAYFKYRHTGLRLGDFGLTQRDDRDRVERLRLLTEIAEEGYDQYTVREPR